MDEEPNKKLTEYFEEPLTEAERNQIRYLVMMLTRFLIAVIIAGLVMGFVVTYLL